MEADGKNRKQLSTAEIVDYDSLDYYRRAPRRFHFGAHGRGDGLANGH